MPFGDYGSESLFPGPGFGVSIPAGAPRVKDPRKEYIAAGPGWMSPAYLHTMSNAVDDLARAFGPRVYQAMLTDPAVYSSFNSLKIQILNGGIRVKAPQAYKAPAWYKPGEATGEGEAEGGRSLSPQQKRCQEILEFDQRLLDRLGEDLTPTLFGWLDAMAVGAKLAELTYEVPEDGPDAGMMVWQSVRIKPNWAWRFVVDAVFNVKGILSWNVTNGLYEVIDPEKMVWMSWMPYDSDPRGTSILRAAYHAWNLKIQNWPLYYQYLVRFGSPGIDGEMAEGDVADRAPVDVNGVEIPGAPLVSSAEYFASQLRVYRSGGVIVHPNGSSVNVIEPHSSGEAFLQAFELWDRQIMLAIQGQTRTGMESKHGSRADSVTAQDEKGVLVNFGRETLAGVVRKALKHANTINFGKTDAELYTGTPAFGKADHQDRASLWSSVANLHRSGYLGQSQQEELDAEVGLPPRDAEADFETKKAEMEAGLTKDQNAPPSTDRQIDYGKGEPPGDGAGNTQ